MDGINKLEKKIHTTTVINTLHIKNMFYKVKNKNNF